MQQDKPFRLQNTRRIGMIIGIVIFILFAYKASHDVSNPKIAAGERRFPLVNSSSSTLPVKKSEVTVFGLPNTNIQPQAINNPSVVKDSDDVTASQASHSIRQAKLKDKTAKYITSRSNHAKEK
jgi:hypothetical protein